MLKPGEKNIQPAGAGWYRIIKTVLILTALTLPVLIVGGLPVWLPFWNSLMFVFALPLSIYLFLENKSVSFIIDNSKIEITSGIVIKKSRSIPFNAIQNIEVQRRILANLLGVWVVVIWTSSPGQVNYRDRKDIRRPDGLLVLSKENAKALNDVIFTR